MRLEEGLDAFVVVDGLPVVPEDSKAKLIKFILRKMADVGTSREDQVRMPLNSETSMTEGYAFIEFEDASQAAAVVKKHHNTPLDRKHIMKINKLTDIEHYGREGRIDDEYQAPDIAPFQPREHQREWLKDPEGRDQFIAFRGEEVGIYWNEQEGEPEKVVERKGWTDTFAQWSPLGTYLTTMHAQGVQLWSGKSWGRKKILHPGVDLIDYSPDERFLITWSHLPLEVSEGNPVLSAADDGKNYIIWDLATELPIRSFVTLDPPGSHEEHKDLSVPPPKKKLQWPAFKWSCDSKYVARLTQAQSGGPYTSISVYELPGMGLLDKTSIKIEGVADFEWCPALPQRDSVRSYEQLFCYWTPELGSNPAKVGLMSIPSKEVVRTQNLFNVMDAKLHWQSESAFVCVKVDRHSKSKKFLATVLEIFRVKEKGLPVEVIDTIKDTVINFAWEPQGDRFVLITAGEMVEGATVPPKTAVSFYCPEKARANTVGNFKLIRTEEKKNNNAIHWSPRGRFVVVSTVLSQQSFDLNFWDLDYEGDKDEKDKDLTANLQLVATAHHYGVTDIEWDPSGRFVATSVSIWKHRVCYNLVHVDNDTDQHRWKMATTCTTSRVHCYEKTHTKPLSNGHGDRDRSDC